MATGDLYLTADVRLQEVKTGLEYNPNPIADPGLLLGYAQTVALSVSSAQDGGSADIGLGGVNFTFDSSSEAALSPLDPAKSYVLTIKEA